MARKVIEIKASGQKSIMRKRVAAYVRVSSGKEAMLHSLSAQVSHYSRMIQSNPQWEYAGVYVDGASTGTSDGRLEFQRMLEDCRNGKLDMVITKSISRFARNTLTLLETVRELKGKNVDVYFERENIHSISGDGELMLTILASFAQEESLSVSENCKWRIRKGFSQGELLNLRFMYGYNVDTDGLTINQKEARTVRMVFSDYLGGMGTSSIAKKLREMDVERPRGGTWTSERVAEILKNEKYAGNALLQKKLVKDHLSKKLVRNKGDLPQYYVEDSHPPIIDKADFEKVQTILKENAQRFSGGKRKGSYPFTGMVRCGMCGKNFNRKSNHGRVYWGCSTYLHFGKDECNGGQVPERVLIDLARDILGLEEFSEGSFKEQVEKIDIPGPFKVQFTLKNGSFVEREWKHRPRKQATERRKG